MQGRHGAESSENGQRNGRVIDESFVGTWGYLTITFGNAAMDHVPRIRPSQGTRMSRGRPQPAGYESSVSSTVVAISLLLLERYCSMSSITPLQ